MLTQLQLFSFFPRRVGIPSKITNSLRDFLAYYSSAKYNPNGAHTSIYDVTPQPFIDKVLFEFDGNDLNLVRDEVITLTSEFESKRLPYYIVFSGRKGFHVYLLLNPQRFHVEVAKAILKDFVSEYIYDFKFIDTTKTGVLSTIRIPNSRNGNRFAVPLPYDFHKWSVDRLLKYSETPKEFPSPIYINFKTISELTNTTHYARNNPQIQEDEEKYVEFTYLPYRLLKDLLRPCTFHLAMIEDPKHIIRFNLVAELKELGISAKTIYNIVERLNWIDFDPDVTANQISYIFKNRLKPFSCKKTKPFVSNFCTNCRWNHDRNSSETNTTTN